MLEFLGLGSGSAGTHPVHPGWPEATDVVKLADGSALRLRPLARSDGDDWRSLRVSDEEFLRPVEPTIDGPWEGAHSRGAWWQNFGFMKAAAKQGTVVPLAIELNGRFVGQLTLGNVQHGAVSECWIGYWVHSSVTGRGVATAAVALGTDLAFQRVGLNRVTATFLPSNPASGVVLEHNGYRQEGVLRRNLHIDGEWRDHIFVAQVRDDFESTCVSRLVEAGRIERF